MPDDVSILAPMDKESFIETLEEAGKVHTVKDLGPVVVTVKKRPNPRNCYGGVAQKTGWVPLCSTENSQREGKSEERSVTWAPFPEVLE